MVWVIFVVHKIARLGWIWNVGIQFLKGSALKLSRPAHLRDGKKDAYYSIEKLDRISQIDLE